MRMWKPEGGRNGEWRMVEFEDGAMLEAMEEERLWSVRERAQLEAGGEEEESVCRGFVAERGSACVERWQWL